MILDEYLSAEGITIPPTQSGLIIISLEKGKGKKGQGQVSSRIYVSFLEFSDTIFNFRPL